MGLGALVGTQIADDFAMQPDLHDLDPLLRGITPKNHEWSPKDQDRHNDMPDRETPYEEPG